MNKESFINRFAEEISDGSAAIFAGAGLSKGSGYVDWKGLLQSIADELNVEINTNTDLVDLAQYYANESGNNTELSRLILNSVSDSATPNRNHRLLASLPIDTYWTTNYDKLIETALLDEKKVVDIKSDVSSLPIAKRHRDVVVYKMNGDVDHPADTILTRNQFENYPNTHKAFLNALSSDLFNKTFLFIGLSFNDPTVKYILSYIRQLFDKNQRTHYYILKEVERWDGATDEEYNNAVRMQQLFIDDLKRYNIQAIPILDFSEMPEILEGVRKKLYQHTIFISGAVADYPKEYDKDQFNRFLRDLSALAIQSGFKIVNGYGLGFGNEVVAGAAMELGIEDKPFDKYVKIFPFPQGIPDFRAAWAKYRHQMISQAGVSIFLIGNKVDKATGTLVLSNGVEEEYRIAKSYGQILIPVGATGFMAEKLWNAQHARFSIDTPDIAHELEALGDKSKSLGEILSILKAIFSKIK